MSSYTTYGLQILVGGDIAGTAIPAASSNHANALDAAAGHVYQLNPVSSTEEAWYTVNATLTSGVFHYAAPGGATGIRLTTSPTGMFVYQTPVTGSAGGAITWGNPLLTVASGVGGFVPTGAILPYGSSSAPSGWLNCDGSAVSRATYAALFAVVSGTYGVGDGSTTFNVPNLQANVPVGYQPVTYTMGAVGGTPTVTLTSAQIPASLTVTDPGHTHTMGGSFQAIPTGGGQDALIQTSQLNTGSNTTGISVGGGGAAHNNLQPYVVVNFIIKT